MNCERCGENPVTHRGTRNLCCACNVGLGYPPADWHPACMAAWNARAEAPKEKATP